MTKFLSPEETKTLFESVELFFLHDESLEQLRVGGDEAFSHFLRKRSQDDTKPAATAYRKALRAVLELAQLHQPSTVPPPKVTAEALVPADPLLSKRLRRIPVVSSSATEQSLSRSRTLFDVLAHCPQIGSLLHECGLSLLVQALAGCIRHMRLLLVLVASIVCATLVALFFEDPLAAIIWLCQQSVLLAPRLVWLCGRQLAAQIRGRSEFDSVDLPPLPSANSTCTCVCATSPAPPFDVAQGWSGPVALLAWMGWLAERARARWAQ